MRQVIVDTETTGLSTAEGHRIIEIGCVELINRRVTGQQFHRYIDPEREIEHDAEQVHGITREFLQGKPVFSAVAAELVAFIQGAELIIHNAPFDVGFLDYEFDLLKGGWKKITDLCQVTDTLVLARQHHPGQRNNLDALCKRYGVDNTRREWHGALLDAHLLAQVYLAMTGGQASLFDVSGPTETDKPMKERKTAGKVSLSMMAADVPLRVIQANLDEMELHQTKLAAMREKGKCVWEE